MRTMWRRTDMPPITHLSLPELVGSALFIGVVSVLLLHKHISKSFQLFREGWDSDLFWAYCDAFREKGWEIFWGPTVFGIIFGVATLWYSPLLTWFLVYLLTVVFTTGYYLWRVDHKRLSRKLEFGDVRIVPTTTTIAATGAQGPARIVIQIYVRCAKELAVRNCTGHLLSVWKWSSGGWQPTEVDEPLDLLWSIIDKPIRTLEPGIDRRLCIFNVDNVSGGQLAPWAERTIHRMAPTFAAIVAGDILKFDIAVRGKGCPTIKTSLKVQIGTQWDKPIITPI